MDEAWQAKVRYKLLEDKLTELKKNAWANFPADDDIFKTLGGAERELESLKAWIEINFQDYQMKG